MQQLEGAAWLQLVNHPHLRWGGREEGEGVSRLFRTLPISVSLLCKLVPAQASGAKQSMEHAEDPEEPRGAAPALRLLLPPRELLGSRKGKLLLAEAVSRGLGGLRSRAVQGGVEGEMQALLAAFSPICSSLATPGANVSSCRGLEGFVQEVDEPSTAQPLSPSLPPSRRIEKGLGREGARRIRLASVCLG